MRWSDVKAAARQAAAWAASYVVVAASTASGSPDEVEGDGSGDPDEPEHQAPVRRMWPFGVRSRPPAGVEGVVVFCRGSSYGGVMVGAESAKYGPSDLKDGELALYCKKAGCLVKLDEDGAVTATNASGGMVRIDKDGGVAVTPAPGKDVVLAGGALKVARVTDALQGTAGPYPISGVVAATGGAASVKA